MVQAAAHCVANAEMPVQIRLGALTTVPNGRSLQTSLNGRATVSRTVRAGSTPVVYSDASATCTVVIRAVREPGFHLPVWGTGTRRFKSDLPDCEDWPG